MKIFFDFDGPIIDVSKRYYQVYYEFCILNGLKPTTERKYWQMKKNKDKFLLPQQLQNKFKSYWLKNIESSKNLEFDRIDGEARAILKKLSAKFELQLITLRRDKKKLFCELKRFKIDKVFKKVFIAPPLPFKSKENWRIKLKALKGVSRPGDVIIGDTGTDIICGKKLGLITVGVLSGISNSKILKLYLPDYLINSIKSLPKLKIFKKNL